MKLTHITAAAFAAISMFAIGCSSKSDCEDGQERALKKMKECAGESTSSSSGETTTSSSSGGSADSCTEDLGKAYQTYAECVEKLECKDKSLDITACQTALDEAINKAKNSSSSGGTAE